MFHIDFKYYEISVLQLQILFDKVARVMFYFVIASIEMNRYNMLSYDETALYSLYPGIVGSRQIQNLPASFQIRPADDRQ